MGKNMLWFEELSEDARKRILEEYKKEQRFTYHCSKMNELFIGLFKLLLLVILFAVVFKIFI